MGSPWKRHYVIFLMNPCEIFLLFDQCFVTLDPNMFCVLCWFLSMKHVIITFTFTWNTSVSLSHSPGTCQYHFLIYMEHVSFTLTWNSFNWGHASITLVFNCNMLVSLSHSPRTSQNNFHIHQKHVSITLIFTGTWSLLVSL